MVDIAIQILGIFAMIGIGVVATRCKWFPEDFSTHLSGLLIRIFYPCLLFSAILKTYTLEKIAADWILPAGAAGIILVGWGTGWIAKRLFVRHTRAPTRRAFHFTCTMNNYSFLPIMIVAGTPLGEVGVAMVALTTIASDTLMWTLGFQTFTGRKATLCELPKMLLRPPVFALFAAILLLVVFHFCAIAPADLQSHAFSNMLLTVLNKYLGGATIPTSALVCGMRLGQLNLKGILTPLQCTTTLFRMVLIPAIVLALLCFLPLTPDQRFVLGIIALMPGAMASVSVAEVYGGDIPFVSAMILNTHVACLFTVPLGLWLLERLCA